jgi:hypothetical protein
MYRAIAFTLILLGACHAAAQDQLQLDPEIRAWFRNPDGSCVQCSIGMCGVWCNQPKATTLLWDTEYGKAVRGGSGPSRVEEYADRRQMPIYNVTGDGTYEWMKWASKTGRMSAIGCFTAHFQTLFWYDPTPGVEKPWKVCNNNTPTRIDEYTDEQFRRYHRASGYWIVILKTPSPPMYPRYVEWWRNPDGSIFK